MNNKLVFNQAKGKFVVTMKEGDAEPVETENKEELVGEGKLLEADEVVRVTVGLEAKFGLPNYSSAGCSVSISIPCSAGEEDDAFGAGKDWCEEKMGELAKGITSG